MTEAETKLLKLAAYVIDSSRGDGYPGDLDGGALQDRMESLGVLVAVPVHEPCDPEGCSCMEYGDFPMECYRLEAMVRHALSGVDPDTFPPKGASK
jgi:hypothetical protein